MNLTDPLKLNALLSGNVLANPTQPPGKVLADALDLYGFLSKGTNQPPAGRLPLESGFGLAGAGAQTGANLAVAPTDLSKGRSDPTPSPDQTAEGRRGER